MTFREKIVNGLKEKREKLTNSSLTTYSSLLNSIFNKLKTENTKEEINFFKNEKDEILKYIESLGDTKNQTTKTILSSLFILTGDADYQKLMLEKMKAVNENYKSQTMNQKQKDNFLTINEIREKQNELETILKNEPSSINFQNVLMLGLMAGVYNLNTIRRNEYADVKLTNFDKAQDNYYIPKKKEIIFNKYKTFNKYGQQAVKIPLELQKPLALYIKKFPAEYLFNNPKTNKNLSSSEVTKRLSKIFNKQVGCDLLRMSVLSEKYKNIPQLDSMENLAETMGHSLNTALTMYTKKID